MTLSSLAPSIFSRLANVGSLGSVVRLYLGRWALISLYTQVNYLIDEGMNIGKGGNCIISLLHHFLATHNLGEGNLCIHANNCSGQNKNRFVMQYLAWRVLDGRIEISFLIVGHTKFAPDWCFGLLKQAYRRTKVGCLDDIVSD